MKTNCLLLAFVFLVATAIISCGCGSTDNPASTDDKVPSEPSGIADSPNTAEPNTAEDEGVTAAWRSLKGLTGVIVVVNDMSADGRKAGLRQQALQTAVELRLRRNGIKVLSADANSKTLAAAILAVNVPGLQTSEAGLYTYNIRVVLYQRVTTTHKKKCFGATWQKSRLGYVGRNHFKQDVLDTANELTDQFSNAYFKANPKK